MSLVKNKIVQRSAKVCITLMIIVFTNYVKAADNPSMAPDQFRIKAFHLDLRIQVMKLTALKKLAYQLHGQGINALIMEWEGAYPYEKETVISNQYAYKRSEIKEFIRYCHTLNMEVIPLQQTFGHVEYILKHYKYAKLREDQKDLSQVCPVELDSCRTLFTALLKDIEETHDSPYIHIGGDETFLLGHCEKCQRKVAQVGLSGLYFDYIKMICDIVVGMGKKPVVWADIALHYPDKIHLLPKETVFVDWNYGWDLSYFGDHTQLLNSGYEIWGAPALRSEPDNFYLTKWKNHFDNIKNFIPETRKLNYKGIVMTSWSTSGAYCTVFDSNDDPLALYPIRRVCPLSGFNLLINAYTAALKTDEPLDARKFINEYCVKQYGLRNADAGQFQRALFMTPYPVIKGQVQSKTKLSLQNMVDSTSEALSLFKNLKPTKNIDEYSHYILMTDIRLFYLKVLLLEQRVNGDGFNLASAGKLVPQVEGLKKKSLELNKSFAALNGSFLKEGEIAAENALRNEKFNELYNQIMAVSPAKTPTNL